jgi:DNA polymerase-3 subunit alpha
VAAEFVHLHVHSQYSLLDGALKIKDLASKTKALGMRAVALTDHGNMFGAIQLYKACKDVGVGAILGCEVNVARHRAREGAGKSEDPPVDHLVLLASNAEGYKSLIRIVSEGHVAQASGVAPSVTLDLIAQHNKGVIGLSGCMGGVLAQRVLESGEDDARSMLDKLTETFEPGNFYVELQDHGLVEQPVLNGILARLAAERNLPLVATNDAHFANRDDGEGHLYLSCIAANRSYADAFEAHHQSFEMFLKSPDEMAHTFRDYPQAIKSTLEIAERCSGLKSVLHAPMLPRFPLPDGYDTDSYFRHVSHEGLTRRFEEFRR